MKRRLSVLLMLMFLFATVFSSFIPLAYAEDVMERIGGIDRYGTAAKIAMAKYSSAKSVIIGRGDSAEDGTLHAIDSAVASLLAGALDAPILITRAHKLEDATSVALAQLGAEKVYIVGGPQAINENVEKKLALTYEVERIAGMDRYETAAKVAEATATGEKTAIIVNGFSIADCLAAGPLAYSKGYPILLVKQNSIPKVTQDAITKLGIENVIIVGNEDAVGSEVVEWFESHLSGSVSRVGGKDIYELSANMVKNYFANSEGVILVSGESLIDAAAGSVFGLPILYVKQNEVPGSIKAVLGTKMTAKVLGGSVAVSDTTLNLVKNNLKSVNDEPDSTNGEPDSTSRKPFNVEPFNVVAVTASSDDGNVPTNTIDNLLETRWSAKGDGQWIKYDLGSSQRIGYVGIAFYKGNERCTIFDIEVSEDNENWITVYSGRSSGTTAEMEVFDFEDVTARYVKIIGHGYVKNDGTPGEWTSITEVHIYPPTETGEPVLKPIEKLEPEQRQDVEYKKAGLFNPDGSEHIIHTPNPVTGKTLNVVDFGADPEDNEHNDYDAVQKALSQAVEGDEIYFPDGVYNLTTAGSYALLLKSGVNLRGESRENTILIADFQDNNNPTSVIKILGQHDIQISNMTITSRFTGSYSKNYNENNPDAGGAYYGIYIEDDSLQRPSYNITVNNVIVENFRRMGIRISKSHDVVVRGCVFRNATDVGGGGAGYGVSIQGEGHGVNRVGYKNDCRFNVVEECQFIGPYLRHGVILQYYAHNNVVRNNIFEETCLDAIDLHGEDEYNNEVYGNVIRNVITGAGIGVGNTGAEHDSSGPNNYIHDNTIINCREGIKVHLGSPNTIIENNTIKECSVKDGKGIYLLNAPGTIVRGNEICDNKSEGFWGIVLAYDPGTDGRGVGNPTNIQIINNRVCNNTNGVKIEAGIAITLENNTIEGNEETDFIDTRTEGSVFVSSADEISAVLSYVQPGDTIIMKNGVWKDQHIVFEAEGTAEAPITLRAETPGEVILTGSSYLRIAGKHLVVDGLYFKEGTPKEGAVIEFRNDKKDKEAHYCRLTNTAIAYYNPPDENMDYKWVSLYGTHNRVDHCDFRGKNHSGALLVVWREDDSPQYHQIDHNYFAYIPKFSRGNDAEAIRVGTSDHSLSDSFTTVEYNLFEQCNGEIEIISNKSGSNVYRYNTFIDCAGTLTLRHGNNCTVEGNFFFGNNYPGTGGIRVIGEGHKVINNYITGIAGDAGTFRSAICLTNGIPNSPLNGYFQVKNALIAKNILVHNEKNIYVGGGKSDELSLPPKDCVIEENIVVSGSGPLIRYVDEPENIVYKNNIMYGAEVGISPLPEGINIEDPQLSLGEDGLYHPGIPTSVEIIGKPLTEEEVGPAWVKQKAAEGDPAFRKRNLYEEEYSQEVSVPWDTEDLVIVMNVGVPEAYVNQTKTRIDVKNSNVVPIIKNEKILVPVRFIAEKSGARVERDSITSTETIYLNGKEVQIKSGSNEMYVDGEKVTLEIPAEIFEGNMYIPLHAIADALDKSVYWDEQRGLILICGNEETMNALVKDETLNDIMELYRVVASSHDGNVPANTVDNDLSTRWSAEGDGQWIRYYLGQKQTIDYVKIAFYKGDERATYFDIEVSNDGFEWTKVYSGQSSGTSDQMEKFDFEDVEALYVRIVGHMNTSNTWNSILEVQIYSPDGQPLLYPVRQDEQEEDSSEDENISGESEILPTDDAFVEIGKPDQNFGNEDKIRVKTNESGSIVRIAYLKFKVSEPSSIQSAVFRLTGKLTDNNPDGASYEYEVYGITDDNWDENTITWNNSPNHVPDGPQVTGVGETAFLLGTITMSEKGVVKSYTLDVTDFVKSQEDGVVTLMVVDSKAQDGNTDIYSKERKDEAYRPVLLITR